MSILIHKNNKKNMKTGNNTLLFLFIHNTLSLVNIQRKACS